MSETENEDWTAERRNGHRPSMKGEAAEEVEPLRYQSTRRRQASTSAPCYPESSQQQQPHQQQQQQQQLMSDLMSIFSNDDTRQERRAAMHFLNKVLPGIVTRLRELHPRLEAEANEQRCNTANEYDARVPWATPEERDRYFDEVQLIVDHPISDQHPPQDQPRQWPDNAPKHPVNPVPVSFELISLVASEMRKMIDSSHALIHWITLSMSPPKVATRHELEIRQTTLALIARIVQFCKVKMTERMQYIFSGASCELRAFDEPLSSPLSSDRMSASTWQKHANSLAAQCELLMHFVQTHIHTLEQNRANRPTREPPRNSTPC